LTDKILILVTAASQDEARRIARHLVEAKLAACVNITQPVESIYRWEGELQVDQECQLFIKTTHALFPEVQAAIARLHSYKTPEIICLPIVRGSEKYLKWIDDSVKSSGPAEENPKRMGETTA